MMRDTEHRSPTFSLVRHAFSPGDVIWMLNDDGDEFIPVRVLEIRRHAFLTERGEVLFADHGWLWRALKPSEPVT